MPAPRRAVTSTRTVPAKYYVGRRRPRPGSSSAAHLPTRQVDWACAGHPALQIFHPWSEQMLAEAQHVCATCPARTICLARGVELRESGVWGGVMLDRGEPTEHLFSPPAHRRTEAGTGGGADDLAG